MLRPGLIFARGPTSIAVMPIADASNDPLVAQMAADVSGRLTDGLAKIENIRVLAPETGAPKADFVVKGELQKSEQAWTIRTRMTNTATGEVTWTASYQVNPADTDLQMQQSRLAAGVGHALALRINQLLNGDTRSAAKSKVVIEQATAHINQTSPERFQAAQAMLEKALAEDPGNVEVQVALAALLMRGVQMVWLSPAEREASETKAERLLQQTLRAKPHYIPAHEAYCRFLNATNQFSASLVACAKALSFDPWNGIALFHIGLGQIQTGRFEDALATFKQADRFDTPQVSRWTWMIGAGWANHADGPCRRRRAVAAEVDRDHLRQRTHAYVAGSGLSAAGQDRRSQSGDGKGPRIAARLDRAKRPDAQKEFQPGLYRGGRTDHAVDGGGGLAGELTLRPGAILSSGPATCCSDCGQLQSHPTSCRERQATARA